MDKTVGPRYGFSRQCSLLMYSPGPAWRVLPVRLLYGRSDFLIITEFPGLVSASPHMSSKLTQISAGTQEAQSEAWMNYFGSLYNGQHLELATDLQTDPWLQLDFKSDIFIVVVRKTRNEDGICIFTGGG